jgi:hypothetical protein
MLAGSRCRVSADACGDELLCPVALLLVEGLLASKPQVAATLDRGSDEQDRVVARHAMGHGERYVIEEEQGPAVAAGGTDVDLGTAGVVCSGPGQRELLQGAVAPEEHAARG